jgi:mRNA interferase RelE/StbE
MRFELRFEPDALKEWQALDKSVREPLKKKLAKRLLEPHVPNERLHHRLSDCYKIKNSKTGHRLVYRVIDEQVVVLVLAIGKRERLEAYLNAAQRNSAAS